jgi:hypothetical protein
VRQSDDQSESGQGQVARGFGASWPSGGYSGGLTNVDIICSVEDRFTSHFACSSAFGLLAHSSAQVPVLFYYFSFTPAFAIVCIQPSKQCQRPSSVYLEGMVRQAPQVMAMVARRPRSDTMARQVAMAVQEKPEYLPVPSLCKSHHRKPLPFSHTMWFWRNPLMQM